MALRACDDDDPAFKRYGFTRDDVNRLAEKLGVVGNTSVFGMRSPDHLSFEDKYK
jgi:hypothetical protein